jgi:hypothetical protein
MSGPMSALGAHLSDDPARREPGRASTMCWPSGTTSQRMGDKNEQYLLDHWCDCRRYCRAVLFWASLTRVRQEEGQCGVEEGGWAVTFSPALWAAPRPGPGAAEAPGQKQSRRAPHLLILAPVRHQPCWWRQAVCKAFVALWPQPLQSRSAWGALEHHGPGSVRVGAYVRNRLL